MAVAHIAASEAIRFAIEASARQGRRASFKYAAR